MVLLQKFALFAAGMVLLAQQPVDTLSIVVFLTALIAVSLHTYFEEKFKLVAAISVIYLALCLWDMRFCFFIPLILYEIFRNRIWVIATLSVGIAVYTLYEQQFILLLISVICGISFLLQYLTSENHKLVSELKKTRDNSEELTIELKNKNKYLIEKQDYEVYLATLKERNRIAREIHDNVGHMLSRSILQTGAMMALNKDTGLEDTLTGLKDTLSNAMDSIRQSVHGLHDESVDLYASIEKLINGLPDYDIKLYYDMGETVPMNIKYCFIAIIKEALSNTVKHSNSHSIRLAVREHPAIYQLLIHDNGSFPSGKTTGGMGLLNMQDRVDALGGTLHVTENNGFRIFISVPKSEGVKK